MNSRLYYLDNLRFFLVMLVVFHHSGQAYGPTGGAWPVTDSPSLPWLGMFFSVNAAFFMGLLFFISGFVMPSALTKYGPKMFFISKIKRLLIPFCAVAILCFMPVNYIFGNFNSLSDYLQYLITPDGVQSFTGHLWFVLHLFIYSMLYLLFEIFFTKTGISANNSKKIIPSFRWNASVILFIILLSSTIYLIRTVFEIDRWIVLMNIIRMEAAHLPQYFSFFVLGVIFSKFKIFERIKKRDLAVWLFTGIIIVIITYLPIFGVFSFIADLFGIRGGSGLLPLLRSFWETALSVSVCIGLLFIFNQFLNKTSRVWGFLTENSYGVYLIHVFSMVGIQMFLLKTFIPTEIKFIGVSIETLMICYVTIFFLRKIPKVREYI